MLKMASKLTALFLLAASAVLAVKDDSIRHRAQSPFSLAKDGVPMTIGARSEVSVANPAEIAEADIAVHACHNERSEAEKRTDAHLKVLEKHFKSLGLNTSVPFTTTVQDGDDDEWDESMYRSGRGRKASYSGEDEEPQEKPKPSFCGSSTLTVTVTDLSLLPHLSANLSAQYAEARLEFVDWRLTDATKMAKKTELRQKALREMTEIGKDYAKILGVENVVPMHLDEQYGYEDTRVSRARGRMAWRMERDEVDLRVPEVQIFTEFKFEFRM